MVLLGAVGSSSNFYKNSTGLTEFCKKLCMRKRAVLEVFKLMRQLEKTVKHGLPDFELKFPIPGMSADQANLLQQVVISSFGDQIAVKSGKSGSGKNPLVTYQAQMVDDDLFIHPSSVFHGKSYASSPDMIVYQEIIESESGRTYMKECMSVSDLTLIGKLCESLCTYSPPIIDDLKLSSLPRFCHARDTVVCKVKASFGKKSWPLHELVEIPYPGTDNNLDKFRWFSRLLLEGKVFSEFKSLNKFIVIKAGTCTKAWAQDQPAISNLVSYLARWNICGKSTVLACDNKEFLVKCLLAFYTDSDNLYVRGVIESALKM